MNKKRMQFLQLESDREFNEMQIEEREQGIKEIETTILEVNEITRDLSSLVHEQGRMIGFLSFSLNSDALIRLTC